VPAQLADPDLAVAKVAAVYGQKKAIERLVVRDLVTRGQLRDGAPVSSASAADLEAACARLAPAFGLTTDQVRRTVEIEANAATDNPMVFAEAGEIVSGGNFHGAPIAIAADLLAAALVPLATISERRTDRLVDPAKSGLPAFLTRDGGLRSGLMIAQVTAAACASELKSLAHPAGADSIPTSAGREDHVSMSMTAALKAARALERARDVIAVELLCACQAIDLLAPLTTSDPLAHVHRVVRLMVPTLDDDRPLSREIAAIARMIASRELENPVDRLVK